MTRNLNVLRNRVILPLAALGLGALAAGCSAAGEAADPVTITMTAPPTPETTTLATEPPTSKPSPNLKPTPSKAAETVVGKDDQCTLYQFAQSSAGRLACKPIKDSDDTMLWVYYGVDSSEPIFGQEHYSASRPFETVFNRLPACGIDLFLESQPLDDLSASPKHISRITRECN